MRKILTALPFLALSLGLHLAAAAIWHGIGGTPSRAERSVGGLAIEIGGLTAARPMAAPPVVVPPREAKTALPPPRASVNTANGALLPVMPEKAATVAPRRIAPPAADPVPTPLPPKRSEHLAKTPKTQAPPGLPKPLPNEQDAPADTAFPSPADGGVAGGARAPVAGTVASIAGAGGRQLTAGGRDVVSDYRNRVREQLIRNKFYPTMAQRFHLEGVVTFRFTLSREGEVSNLRIVKSSGHALLDSAALRTVERAAPFERFPADIRTDSMEFHFPMTFSLD